MSLALDAAELLFNALANVDGGNWERQTLEWRQAAADARTVYHKALDAERQPPPAPPGRLSDQRILAVLRSDYELVLRLAADRLRTLDLAYPPDAARQAVETKVAAFDQSHWQELMVLREQVEQGEDQCLKLAREVDQSKQLARQWQRRAEEAEQQLGIVREALRPRFAGQPVKD